LVSCSECKWAGLPSLKRRLFFLIIKEFETLHVEPSRALSVFGKGMQHSKRLEVLLELKGKKHTNIDIRLEDGENASAA
jgi:hypothetical protein